MLAFLYKNQFSKSCFEYNSKGVKLLNSVICFFLKVLYRQMGRTTLKKSVKSVQKWNQIILCLLEMQQNE